jgi:hypothetical protein
MGLRKILWKSRLSPRQVQISATRKNIAKNQLRPTMVQYPFRATTIQADRGLPAATVTNSSPAITGS